MVRWLVLSTNVVEAALETWQLKGKEPTLCMSVSSSGEKLLEGRDAQDQIVLLKLIWLWKEDIWMVR